MTADQEVSTSLVAAMSQARIPAGNHEFVRRLTSAVGIAEYRVKAVDSNKPYVVAVRHDGRPSLHIYSGYTTGFGTEGEVVAAAGDGVDRAPSSRAGTWYVVHPVNEVRAGHARSEDVRREAGLCVCGMQLPLTGVCDFCD